MANNLNTVYLSDQTTDYTSAVSVGSHLTASTLSVLGTTHLTGAVACAAGIAATTADFSSTLSADGNTRLAGLWSAGAESSSIVTITANPCLSLTTRVNANDLTIGQMAVVFTASGLSLVYSSGASLYDVGSNTSASQPTT